MTTRILPSHANLRCAARVTRTIAMSALVALSLLGTSGCVAEFGDPDDGAYRDQDVASSEHELANGELVELKPATGFYITKCADVMDGSHANGTPLLQWDCWGPAHQRFRTYVDSAGYWTIVASHSGKCLDVFSPYDGEPIRQNDCHGGDSQKFLLDYYGLFYEIRSKVTRKCLDVANRSPFNGAVIQQWGCHGGDNQRFQIQHVGW